MTENPGLLRLWDADRREAAWTELGRPRDLLIIGGGIMGAGLLNAAARAGLKALLVEQNDFASGTSSRTSKLVHGGLRYLKQLRVGLVRDCVRERQGLLKSAPGLVEPLEFIYPSYASDRTRAWMINAGLCLYTRLASGAGRHRNLNAGGIPELAPGLSSEGLIRGFRFMDAQTDDARLVLRVLQDGLDASQGRCEALNYARVCGLLRRDGRIAGAAVQDREGGRTQEVRAAVVINAAGAWADSLRVQAGAGPRFRLLRGSHLFLPRRRLPAARAVMFEHPEDGRPIFVLPWEGVTLVGTTDVDHPKSMEDEPMASEWEGDYLIRALQRRFPDLCLDRESVLAAQAGVRCVVATGKADPSAESREHALWEERGMLTVAGGKLTTFGLIAFQVLQRVRKLHPEMSFPGGRGSIFESVDPDQRMAGLEADQARRLWGRYGRDAERLAEDFPGLLNPIEGTPYLWAELAWAAGREAVVHLEDLFLRRLRLGLLLEDGGQGLLSRAKPIICEALRWDEAQWTVEVERYLVAWKRGCGVPWS